MRMRNCVLVLLFSLLAVTPLRARTDDTPRAILPGGVVAPDFVLKDYADEEHRSENYRGIGVALAFLPGSDPTSRQQLRSLNRELCEFDTIGVKVFVVTPLSVADARALHEKEGLDFAVLSDPEGTTARAYGLSATDARAAFVIGPDRKIMLPIPETQIAQFGSQLFDLTAACLDNHPQPPSRYLGRKIANFSLPSAKDEKPVSLYAQESNVVTVLFFVSSHCPCSRRYDERVRKISDAYQAKGVRFIAVNSAYNENATQAAGHAWQARFDFPMLKDLKNRIADRLEAHTTPEVFVMDRQGILRYHGRIDDNRNPLRVTSNDLQSALDALLAGKNPVKADRTSFGCAIARAPQAKAK